MSLCLIKRIVSTDQKRIQGYAFLNLDGPQRQGHSQMRIFSIRLERNRLPDPASDHTRLLDGSTRQKNCKFFPTDTPGRVAGS